MQKQDRPHFIDIESGGFNERPLGARMPRSMDEVYHYGRMIGMSEGAARQYVTRVSSMGLGISKAALDKAELLYHEEQRALQQRIRDVEERARQAEIKSPSTKQAIASHTRRQLQKIASRKRK